MQNRPYTKYDLIDEHFKKQKKTEWTLQQHTWAQEGKQVFESMKWSWSSSGIKEAQK